MRNKKISAFGKIVLKRLVDMEKTRKWLAEAIGTNQTRIYDYVTGKCAPSARVLYRIATALELDCNELLAAIASEENQRAS
ncbi:MAG: helix-turn-helix domain-containing protein [Oscillospiraceae bacterium]